MNRNREIYNARVRELIPETLRHAEDAGDSASQVLAREFKDKYGVTHDVVAELFQVGPFKDIIEHMYQDALAEMLVCDIPTAGIALQAQAQLLNLFLGIPGEIAKINDVENVI
jgi:hypothetical protein